MHEPFGMCHRWLLGLSLLLLLAGPSRAQEPGPRSRHFEPWAQQTLDLRRAVASMRASGRLPIAHPAVAKRLSEKLSQDLGRKMVVPPARIVQVQWGSKEHFELKQLLADHSIGIGIYPSPRWGHIKLRIGSNVADTVPQSARPFPSTGTRARLVPHDGMGKRFYEAVFVGDPEHVKTLEEKARAFIEEKRECGATCTGISTLLRGHLRALEGQGLKPFGGRLAAFTKPTTSTGKGWGAAGEVWREALGASPALIVVYTPPWDHRRITHSDFRFDYAE